MSSANETFEFSLSQLSFYAFLTLPERADDRLVDAVIFAFTIYGIIAKLALVLTVLRSKEMRANPSYYLLIQIAACDLILLLLVLFHQLAGIVFRQAFLGSAFSSLNSNLHFIFQCGWWTFVCALTLTAFNRFVCIVFVGRYDVVRRVPIIHLPPGLYIQVDFVVTFTTIGIIVVCYLGVFWRVRQKQASGNGGRAEVRIALQVGLICGIYIINSIHWNMVPYLDASKWTNAAVTSTTPIQCSIHPTIAFLFNSSIRKELMGAKSRRESRLTSITTSSHISRSIGAN